MRAAGLVEGEAAQATGHPASPCAETALAREEVLSAVLLELWAFAGGADLATLRGLSTAPQWISNPKRT